MATVSDFRIEVGLFGHRKTRQLARALGDHGVLCLLRLWEYATQHHHDGVLVKMNDVDIEDAAGFSGAAGELVKTLRAIGWLDRKGRTYTIHQWAEHQPFVSDVEPRRRKAAYMAHRRWHRDKCPEDCPFNAYGNAASIARRNAASITRSMTSDDADDAASNAPAVAVPSHNQPEGNLLSRGSGRRRGKNSARARESGGGDSSHDWTPPFASQKQFQYRVDEIRKWIDAKKAEFVPGEDDFHVAFETKFGMGYDYWLDLRPRCEDFYSHSMAQMGEEAQ